MNLKHVKTGYLLILFLSVTYDLLFTLPPILLHFGIRADLIYRFFQPVCHQMDSRSFHIFGYKLAVCSRCASIYYGFTLGIILYPLFEPLSNVEIPGLRFFLIPLFALVVDFSLNCLSPMQNTFVSRAITGAVFGISAAFFLVPVWISLMIEFATARDRADKNTRCTIK